MALVRLNRWLRFRREDVNEYAILDCEAQRLAAGRELGCDASRVAESLGCRSGQQEVLKRLLESKEDGQNSDQQREPETQPQEERRHCEQCRTGRIWARCAATVGKHPISLSLIRL